MSDASFQHHVSAKKNDFMAWIRDVVHDDDLAEMVQHLDRQEMARTVRSRVSTLEHTASQDPVDAQKFMHSGLRDFAVGAVVGIIVGVGIAMLL